MAGVSQAEFARLQGVNRSTVSRWIKAGRISVDADGRIDPDKAARERTATESPLPHHQARKAQIDAEKAAPAKPAVSDPGQPIEKIGAALKFETYRLQKAKAEAANIEIDKLAGALVERGEVEYVLRDLGQTLRGLLEGLADRLAPAIAAHRGDVNKIHAELDGVAEDLLTEFAEHMRRRSDEVAL